jgi:hypothetical protein
MDYDADRDPDPQAWRAADEATRLAAVEAHHRALRAPHPRTQAPRLHAAVHLVVESQLALDQPPQVRAALARLVAGGLARHEAVHAIGAVAAEVMLDAARGKPYDAAAYGRALDALTVEGWRRGGGDPG